MSLSTKHSLSLLHLLCIVIFTSCINSSQTGKVSCFIEDYPVDGWVQKYFDEDWSLTKDTCNADYYRIAYYVNGEICSDSIVTDYCASGNKQFEGFLYCEMPDTLHGECRWYYQNGQLEKAAFYDKGIPRGEVCEYYENSQLKVHYNMQNNNIHGGLLSYYQDGQIKEDKKYSDGHSHGMCLEYYPDGKLKEKKNYRLGEFNGEWIEYFSDGSIKIKKQYNKGKLHGQNLAYHAPAQLSEKSYYINDILSGEFSDFYQSGAPKSKGRYSKGEKTGTWTYYNENGYYEQMRQQTYRVGARCRDGSSSSATGRGACSHHGGVAYWITETGWVVFKQGSI